MVPSFSTEQPKRPTMNTRAESLLGNEPSRLASFHCPAFHSPIVGMSFKMILGTRPTVEMQNLLSVPRLTHLSAISVAEASGVSDASASCYGVPENIPVLAVVKPESKFVQVQRQILPADMV